MTMQNRQKIGMPSGTVCRICIAASDMTVTDYFPRGTNKPSGNASGQDWVEGRDVRDV
jgi:hypothetical protein